MGILKINTNELKDPKKNDKVWTLYRDNIKYYAKKHENSYSVHAEGYGSFITHKYNPKTIRYTIASDEDETIYTLSEDINKDNSYIELFNYPRRICTPDFIDMMDFFNEIGVDETFKYDFFMMLIEDAFTLNTDRHNENIFISNKDSNISLAPLIDFNCCFSGYNVLKLCEIDAMKFCSNISIETVEKEALMSYYIEGSDDIKSLIHYLKKNNLYVDFVSNQADNMSYEADLKEYEEHIGDYVPEYVRAAFIELGNARKERMKKLINEPIVDSHILI